MKRGVALVYDPSVVKNERYYHRNPDDGRPLRRPATRDTRLTKTRSWPVRAIGLLLVLQAAGLGGICAYDIYRIDWQEVQRQSETEASVSPELAEAVEQAVVITLIFGPPAVLALLAAFGFFLLSRIGWLLAMFVQALTLLACLLLYAEWEEILYQEPLFIYPVMLYCIVMVLYLNSSDVRAAFQVRRRTGARRAARHGL